jgi:hypothetical protein
MTADPWDVITAAFPQAPKPVRVTTPVLYRPTTAGSPYAQRALDAEAQRVVDAPAGSRNHTLNRAAFSLGQLVAGGALEEDEVVHALTLAAHQAGLDDDEIAPTLRSGLQGGQKDPRGVPETPDVEDWLSKLPVVEPSPAAVPAEPGQDERLLYNPETGEVVGVAPRPLPAMDLALLSQPCPEPEWLVEGRMTRRSLTLLGAKPGIGKSWTALDLTLALTTGRDWLGHKVHGRHRVLYIDVENGDVLARRRLQQLGADAALIGDRLHYVTEAVMFPGGDDSRRYRDTLAAFRPDLVVIDTLASAAPSAEKDTEAMSLFLSDVWHRAREAGASVLVLAHLRKSQQGAGKDDPLDSFRGAGHLVGAASRAWLLDPRGAETFVLRDVKTREFSALPPVRISLVDEDMPPGSLVPRRTTVTVDGYEDDEVSPDLAWQRDVLAFIDNHPHGQATTKDLQHLAEAAGLAEKTASNLLTEWARNGVLRRLRKGLYARPDTAQTATHQETA